MAVLTTEVRSSLPTRSLVLLVLAFGLGWVAINVNMTGLNPVLPVLKSEFGLTGTQMGAISSTYFLFYVLVQIPSGLLGDRFGLKRVLMAGFMVVSVGVLGVGLLSKSYPLLLAFMAFHGLGAGTYFPISYAVTVTSFPPDKRGLSAALIASGMAVGLVLGLTIPAPLYAWAGNWRTLFIFSGLFTLGVVLVFWRWVQHIQPVPRVRGVFLAILRHRDIMLICLASFCATNALWVALTWSPTFLVTERGLSLNTAGLLTAVMVAFVIPASLTFGRLSDRVGRRRFSLLMLPIAAAAIFAMGLVKSVGLLIPLFVVFGLFGPLSWSPIAVAWVGDLVSKTEHKAMGTTMGVFNTATMASSIVAPLVSGLIRDTTGSFQGAFYFAAAALLCSALLALLPREAPWAVGTRAKKVS